MRNSKLQHRIFRLIVVFLLGIMAVVSQNSAGLPAKSPAKAAALEVTGGEIEDTYALDSRFVPPALVAEVDGRQIKTEAVVVFPDGTARRQDAVILSQPGRYTLEYRFIDGDNLIETQRQTFDVFEPNYSLSGNGSIEYLPAEQLRWPDLGDGLAVTVSENTKLAFTKTVNIKNFTAVDPILEFYIDPTNAGNADFEHMTIRLEDANDADNYVTVQIYRNNEEAAAAYASAGAAGQPMSGLQAWDGKVQQDNQYGAGVFFPFTAEPLLTYRLFSLRLDQKTKWIYAGNVGIIDLDEPAYFDSPWQGFSGGEVKLTISADMFNTASGRIVITHVAGQDLSQAAIPQSLGQLTIATAADEYGSTLPPALTGNSYPIPTGSAMDTRYGIRKVSTSVWYNYASSGRVNVNSDGQTFVPQKAGIYTIVYSATDIFGTSVKKTFNITAYDTLHSPTINVSRDDRVTEGIVGQKIPIAAYNASGGSGKLSIAVLAVGPAKSYPIVGGSFTPLEPGVYSVVYQAVDHIGQKTTSVYNVDITVSTQPIFAENPVLLDYFISGTSYVLPEFKAFDYSTNTWVTAGVKVQIGDGQKTVLAADRQVSIESLAKQSLLTITYFAGESEVSFQRPIINPYASGEFEPQSYFVCDDGITITKHSSHFEFSTWAMGSSGFDFINPLLAENLSVRFKFHAEHKAFGAVSFYLTDIQNPAQTIKVQFDNFGQSGDIVFEYARGSVRRGGTTFTKIQKTTSGEAFSGFTSPLVMLRVEFEDVWGAAALNISNISGQPINSVITSDSIAPRVAVLGDMGGTESLNAVRVLPRAAAADVFDASIAFILCVYAPDGAIVTADDGTYLENVDPTREYQITLSSYGAYDIVYTAIDSKNNKGGFSYKLFTENIIYPSITLKSQIKTQVKAGQNIDIPTASAKDVDGSSLRVYRYVINLSGVLVELDQNIQSVTAAAPGVYKIQYMAVNSLGAMTVAEYSVTVK